MATNSVKAKLADANDNENTYKCRKILMKKKLEMSEEERQDHETHCDVIKGKLADMLNKTSSRKC